MPSRSGLAAALSSALVASLLVAAAPSSAGDTERMTRQGGPSARATVSAPIVQPGKGTASSTKAKVDATVTFSPARQGRPVVIQSRTPEGAWTKVARTRQNGNGQVRVTAPASSGPLFLPLTYRGVAPRWKGNPAVTSSEADVADWQAKLTDEFSVNSIGATWADRKVQSSSRRCSTVGDPRASDVSNGALRLRVMLDPDRRGQVCRIRRGPDKGKYRHYLNGMVGTGHFAAEVGRFSYGTFAARVKFPQPQGQHGSFWLQDPTMRDGAEIDIVEFFGKGYPDGGLASFLYNYSVRDKRGDVKKIGGLWPQATKMLPRRDAWWKRYHVFSLDWSPRGYEFAVDGRVHFKTRRGLTDAHEYLILSMLSSDWELKRAKRLGVKPGGTMSVDWVRVWQRG